MNTLRLSAIKTVLFLAFVAAIIIAFSLAGLGNSGYKASEAVNLTSKDNPVIVIDPGHGGEDGGAEANGAVEKDINLAISRMLSSYLDMSCFENVLTRNEDRLLYNPGEENNKKRHDLQNRVKFAEEYSNAIFVSIHQNKFEIPKYKGLQVYYSENNPNSKQLAKLIQTNAKNNLDNENKREVKQADFRIRVLDKLKIPAVLVECGFLSNAEEAALLTNPDYQKKIAFTIYLSLMEYLEITENQNEE